MGKYNSDEVHRAGMDRMMRHQQAILSDDTDHLRQTLRSAGDRFSDIADELEKDRTYDPVGFMRESAKRCHLAADNKS